MTNASYYAVTNLQYPTSDAVVADSSAVSDHNVTTTVTGADQPRDSWDIAQEVFLVFIAITIGVTLNVTVLLTICLRASLRRMTNAFIFHGCVLDIAKCLYVIPFAKSLLTRIAPASCDILMGSKIIAITTSSFNLIAMICCEVYFFGESNIGNEAAGTVCCVLTSFFFIYVGAIIVHLGPTVIAGQYTYQPDIGMCMYSYGTMNSYVSHAIWLLITSLILFGAIYYLSVLYRMVRSNESHRITSLARKTVDITRGKKSVRDQEQLSQLLRNCLNRVVVLSSLVLFHLCCYYPLFILVMSDRNFDKDTSTYRYLTYLLWSNGVLNPVPFVLFDRQLNLFSCLLSFKTWCGSVAAPVVDASTDDLESQRGLLHPASPNPSCSNHLSRSNRGSPQCNHQSPGRVRVRMAVNAGDDDPDDGHAIHHRHGKPMRRQFSAERDLEHRHHPSMHNDTVVSSMSLPNTPQLFNRKINQPLPQHSTVTISPQLSSARKSPAKPSQRSPTVMRSPATLRRLPRLSQSSRPLNYPSMKHGHNPRNMAFTNDVQYMLSEKVGHRLHKQYNLIPHDDSTIFQPIKSPSPPRQSELPQPANTTSTKCNGDLVEMQPRLLTMRDTLSIQDRFQTEVGSTSSPGLITTDL